MFSMKAMSAEQAVAYHKVDDYYSENSSMEKQAAKWHGKLAAELGLSGPDFDFVKFADACRGKFGGKTWKQKPDRKRALYDFTFSAPKSVSIQALHKCDGRLIAAHDLAVMNALAFLEIKARVRLTQDGKTEMFPVSGLAMALMRHTTSRKGDPQLHTHCVTFNVVMGPDGKLRSITPDDMMNFQKTADAIYKQVLATQLREAGYDLIPTKNGYELAGYDRKIIRHFSQRLEDIEEHLKKRGLDINSASAKAKEFSTLASRDSKREIERKKLKSIWRERAKEIGFKAPPIPNSLKEKDLDARREIVEFINRNLTKATSLNRAIVENSRVDGGAARVNAENFSETVAAHRVANAPSQISGIERGEQSGGDENKTANEPGIGELDHERNEERNVGNAEKFARFPNCNGASNGQHYNNSGRPNGTDGGTGRGNLDADGRHGVAGRERAGAAVPSAEAEAGGQAGMGSYGSGAVESGSQQHQKDKGDSEISKRKRSLDQLHAAAATIRERNGIAAGGSERTGTGGRHDSNNRAEQGDTRVEASPLHMTAHQALTHVVKNLTANRLIITNGRDSVIFAAMNAAHSRICFQEINVEMERMMATGQLLVGRNGRSFVAFETLEIENRIDAAYDQARNAELPMATAEASDAGIAKMEAHIASRLIARHEQRLARKMTDQEKDIWNDRCRLTKDQAAMVRGIMQNKDGISVVQGGAGTGKSPAMEAVKMIAESVGMAVYGLGPSAKAMEALSKTGINSVTTTAAMKNPQFWEKLNEKSVVVVDEAGFVGAKTLGNIIARARSAGARLVLVGDTKQFGSVEAGAALNQLRDKAKANGALHCLDEMRRGETDFIRDVHFASRDNSASVIDMLYDKGHISVMRDRCARLKAIGQAYASRTEKERENTMILTDRNVDRIAINAAVRLELALKDEVTVQNFERKDLTKVAMLSINNYEVDDVIRFNSDSGKYQKNGVLRVVEKHPAHLVIEDEKGVGARFEPNMEGRNLTVGTVGKMPLAVGERIRFTADEKDQCYINGDAAIVLSINQGRAQVLMDKNKQVIELKLHGDRPVDFHYGYCETGDSTRGGKGEMIIKYETAGGLTNKHSWYTTNTGSTTEIRVFTDILGGKELENLRKKVERSAALDTTRSALSEIRLTDARLKERANQPQAYFSPAVGYEKLDVPDALERDNQFVKEALIKAVEIYKDAPDNTDKQLFVAGTEEFRNFVLDIAMKEKIDVRFSNVDMEERRAQIIAEREQREVKPAGHAELRRSVSKPEQAEQVLGQQERDVKLQLPERNVIKQAIPAVAQNDMGNEFAVPVQMQDEKDLIRKGQECSEKHENQLDADEAGRRKSPVELQHEKQHSTDAKEASTPGTRVPDKGRGDDDDEGSSSNGSAGSTLGGAPGRGSNDEWEQDTDERDEGEDLDQEIDAPR